MFFIYMFSTSSLYWSTKKEPFVFSKTSRSDTKWKIYFLEYIVFDDATLNFHLLLIICDHVRTYL